MKLQKQLLETLEAMDKYRKGQKDGVSACLLRLFNDLQWHRWQVSLEGLATAQAANWCVDASVKSYAFSVHGGQSNTKWTAEDIFSHLQHIVARSQKGCCVMNKRLPQWRWSSW